MDKPAANEQQSQPLDCGEWDATHERRAGKAPILTITGECRLPTTYRVVLKPHEPQEDPDVLVLDLEAYEPPRSDTEIEHSEPFIQLYMPKPAPIYVHYRTQTEHEYKTVTILNAVTGDVIKSGLRVKTLRDRPPES
ncbi:MAG: hypothetical protein M3164_05705 [Actinomycetota bacterium]|nr:hypothetical protein [Actinomycetota bacterium]